MGGDGRFLILWDGPRLLPNEYWKVKARLYDSAGHPVGHEFRVTDSTIGHEVFPAAAFAADGRFVVTWNTSANGVSAQRFDADGSRLGGVIRVADRGQLARIVMSPQGGFTIVWDFAGATLGIAMQRFDAEGRRMGDEVRVNRTTDRSQSRGALAPQPDCGFFVAWNSGPQDGSDYGIFGQILDQDG